MQLRLRHTLSVLVLLFSAACADSPTAPTLNPDGAGPSRIGVWAPGGPSKCDPWMNLDWCEGDPGDPCMTSNPSIGEPEEYVGVQSCPGPGGVPGGGGTPPSPPADTACNTSDNPVLNEANVQAGFEALWNQSGITLAQSQRLESAAWIVRNPDGSHQLVPFSYNQRTACGVNGNFFAPAGAIAFVHTHPFVAGERMTACGAMIYEAPNGQTFTVVGRDGQPLYHTYNNQPSPRDRDLLQNVINRVRKARGDHLLEGYVIDNERITRYGGMNGEKDIPYGRCGY